MKWPRDVEGSFAGFNIHILVPTKMQTSSIHCQCAREQADATLCSAVVPRNGIPVEPCSVCKSWTRFILTKPLLQAPSRADGVPLQQQSNKVVHARLEHGPTMHLACVIDKCGDRIKTVLINGPTELGQTVASFDSLRTRLLAPTCLRSKDQTIVLFVTNQKVKNLVG